MTKIARRLSAMALAGALMAGGALAIAPAATADSRCNKNNHTHGVLWWERTDHFLSATKTNSLPNLPWSYLHTNSSPKLCAK